MAATGYSPIQLYYSTTASAAPTAGNLASGELAINITDGKLYYKDNAGAVQLLSTSTTANGTANGVLYLNGSKVATAGSALTFDGTNLGVGGASEPFGRGYGRWVGISSASNVGLELNAATGNAVYFDIGVNGTRTFNIYSDASSTAIQTANTNPLTFGINFTERMRLTSTGLGIGTSSPVSALNVAGATAISWAGGGTSVGLVTLGTQGTGGSLFLNTASLNSSYASGFGVDGSYSGGKSVINIKAFGVNSGGPYSSDLAFFTSSATSSTEKMRLDSSGNLGIAPQKVFGSGNGYAGNTSAASSATLQLWDSNGNTQLVNAWGSGNLIFGTANAERARIDSSGNLLVGLTAAQVGERLSIRGSGTALAYFDQTTNTSGYSGIWVNIEQNGNNTSTYHFKGETTGINSWYLYGNGTTSYSSDSRLKKNIETARTGYLDDLMQLRVVKYNWNSHQDGTPKELGLIAQEVEQVFPNLIQEHEIQGVDGPRKHIKHSVMEFILIKAIQELKAEFDAYKASHP